MNEAMQLSVKMRGARMRHQQIQQWIGNLSYIANKISSNPNFGDDDSRVYGDMLYIRLYHVFFEIESYLANFSSKYDATYPDTVSAAKGLLNLIAALRNHLHEEDLILLDYLRNCQAHPLQNGFAFWDPQKSRKVAILNKDYQMHEISKVIDEYYLKKFGPEHPDPAYQKDIAARVQTICSLMWTASTTYLNNYMTEVCGQDY